MISIEAGIVSVIVLALPILQTDARTNVLGRLGFSYWYWGTLPIAVLAGLLLAELVPQLSKWPALGIVFHAQWAFLIATYRRFVRRRGHEPRDVFMRLREEASNSRPDSLHSFGTGVIMFVGGLALLYVSQPIASYLGTARLITHN